MIRLAPCPKGYALDQDKAVPPAETITRVRERLQHSKLDILTHTRRIDAGRLDIPVYLSVCGSDARRCMPTRKQMGKGASPRQAEASALMELVERFSFFSFWQSMPGMREASWGEAERLWGDALMPVGEMLLSVHDPLPPDKARQVLDLLPWKFFPATCLTTGRECRVPLEWFKKLGEFNGSSAGNTQEESLLQGVCELAERHVCALIGTRRLTTPTIHAAGCEDPVLRRLMDAFAREGIRLVLKDFSLGLPVPTVAALAWDPATFPQRSKLVLTAGNASSPVKAAIRAITEVAQLAGDFCTNACYEASGLPKFAKLEDAAWLLQGPELALESLPSIEAADIRNELESLTAGLATRGFRVYSIATTHPALDIPAHYSMIPGFAFRERDANQSLGLFIGRMLAEDCEAVHAARGLAVLDALYPGAHFLPFFQGLLELRRNEPVKAHALFEQAYPLQPDADARGLAAFYAAYARTQGGEWRQALPWLERALGDAPEVREYWNLCGVAHFKLKDYGKAAINFEAALRIDKGSALDLANLGLCRKFMGHTSEAAHCLRHALELDPGLDFARTHLAELTG
ncbi:MAG: YcaO-like family protein [Deltaproteobacteria bacterium]|jgi:ribosomal protein S12 methylthiotransferase accessory factor|nr:YcaO-like family protein [Deltaproteobacteria bacterium]